MRRAILLGCLFLCFVPMAFAQEKCEAPVWKTGDQWTFKRPDGNTFSNQVGDVTKDLFIVKTGTDPDRYGYDKETLNLKFVIKEDGRQMKASNDMRKLFNFPIFVGKKWTDTNSRLAGSLSQQQEVTFHIEFNVEGIEDMTTAAGAFKTYKIRHKLTNMKNQRNGWILFWYSPDVKWWVKREVEKSSFWPNNLQNLELVSYALKQ